MADLLPQTFHVYRRGAEPFPIEVTSPFPFLTVSKVPAEGPRAVVAIPRQGPTSIYDVTLIPVVDALRPGPFEGVVKVHTDDSDFPQLEVPVRGEVQ